MATVTYTRTSDANVFMVTGQLTADEIKGVVDRHYGTLETPNIIWDLTRGSMLGISVSDFHQVALLARSLLKRAPRKVAFVGSTDETFALLCMYTAIAAVHEVPAQYFAFLTLGEALEWIQSPTEEMPSGLPTKPCA